MLSPWKTRTSCCFGEEGARRRQLTYGSYLRLPQLLDAQHLESDPPAHDELLFITIHQVYELWFQQLLHEAETARDALVATRPRAAAGPVVRPAPAQPDARDRARAGPAGRRAGDDDAAGLPGVPAAARAGQRLPVGAVPRAGVPLRRQGRRLRQPVPRAHRRREASGCARRLAEPTPVGRVRARARRGAGSTPRSDEAITASLRTVGARPVVVRRRLGRWPRRCSSTTSSPRPGAHATW